MAHKRIRTVLMLVSLLSSFEVAQPELILDLNIGEFCLNSVQCISRCCQRESGLRVARCAPEAAESKECSPSVSYHVYYRCPCESRLVCEVDGSIINSNFRICKDPNEDK
ncbi:hypothetical protein GDO78_016025 [Eleutherodactylus coqui]|uniref:Colipase n=1 Tax=Eleutherodactylus coqui TaxID=57060 RepID=A0A8J6ECZ6_ELECQ|nr:hypothetical protein GDO78_016025 [Eleutherodactylus coqui]